MRVDVSASARATATASATRASRRIARRWAGNGSSSTSARVGAARCRRDRDARGIDRDARVRAKPPQRDTGIAKEEEAFFDEDEDGDSRDEDASNDENEAATTATTATTSEDETKRESNAWKEVVTRKRGLDRGEGGYQSKWWTTKRDCPDGRSGSSETRWAKCDLSGYKEIGFEKSGFNENGETWWETWREVYCRDDFTGVEHIERSADKWARDATSKEWQEKWWERYYAKGAVERGVEKSGREVRQAWWEKWGEQYDGEGATLKWTDKWAENGLGVRWGDKWEERRSKIGSGRKSGETWRVGEDGGRFSRTWGEVMAPDGSVRRYGNSTTGESWDTTEMENIYFDKSQPPTWAEVLKSSERLMSIEPTPEDEDGVLWTK